MVVFDWKIAGWLIFWCGMEKAIKLHKLQFKNSDSEVTIQAHNRVALLKIQPMIAHTKFKRSWWLKDVRVLAFF